MPVKFKSLFPCLLWLGLLGPPTLPAQSARLEVLTFDSQTLQHNPLGDPSRRSVAVFLPAQATNGARLPIIYYLPGYGSSSEPFINDSDSWLKRTQAMADETGPVILVVVDGRTRWGGSQYLNSSAQGNYEDYVCDEIVGKVEAEHPVPIKGIRRVIAGHSSGGYGALRLGMSRQRLFDGVIALSPDADFPVTQLPLLEVPGVTNVPWDKIKQIASGALRVPNGDLGYAFGVSAAYAPSGADHPGEFDWIFDATGKMRQDVRQRWLDNDPTQIAARNPHAFAKNQSVYLDGAAQDEFKANLGAHSVYVLLRARNIRTTFNEPPGHHVDHIAERLQRGWEWISGKPFIALAADSLSGTNGLSLGIDSAAGVRSRDVAMTVDGQRATKLIFGGSARSLTVRYAGVPRNSLHTVGVSLKDQSGETASKTFEVSTFDSGCYSFEAEDFDYSSNGVSGLFRDNPQTNAYARLGAAAGIDYHTAALRQGSGSYRPRGLSTESAGDVARPAYLAGESDYNVGFNNGGSGNWANYTRTFPAGTYHIYMRAASGAGSTKDSASLSLVTGGRGTRTQTIIRLGTFSVPATGDWQTYRYVPLLDSNGNLASFTGGSVQTLRVTTDNGGYNVNYYLLVPAN